MKRFVPGKANPFAVSCIVVPFVMFMYFNMIHLQINVPVIMKQLNVTHETASLLQATEYIVGLIMSTLTSKFCDKYGIPKTYTVGALIYAVFNLLYVIPPLGRYFSICLALRVLSSLGYGIMSPCLVPLATYLVAPKHLSLIITVATVAGPLGSILASFLAGVVAEATEWYYLCVMSGAVLLVTTVFAMFIFPYEHVFRRDVQFDVVGSVLYGVGLTLTVFGLVGYTGAVPLISGILLPTIVLLNGIAALVVFFVYNVWYSKQPIFVKQLFTQRYAILFLSFGFSSVSTQFAKSIENFYVRDVLKVSDGNAGKIISLGYLSALLFAPIILFGPRCVGPKMILVVFGGMLILALIVDTISMAVARSIAFTCVLLVAAGGSYTVVFVLLITTIFSDVPRGMSAQLGLVYDNVNSLTMLAANTVESILQPLVTDRGQNPMGFSYLEIVSVLLAAGAVVFICRIEAPWRVEKKSKETDKDDEELLFKNDTYT